MRKKKYVLLMILAMFSVSLLFVSCNITTSGPSGSGNGDEDYSEVDLTSAWTAYNDCVVSGSGNDPNATGYNWSNTTGLLKKISDGTDTSVAVTMAADNVSSWDPSGMPQEGTDAYETFNGILNINDIASYNSSADWYYEAVFTGLDPAKKYAFVTTANRNEDYEGHDPPDPPRWTKFSISGADTYRNVSSAGVTEVSEAVLKLNTGYNTVNGYVIAWTDITAADGSFTVRSENVGAEGPGELYKSYGMQGFMFKELAE